MADDARVSTALPRHPKASTQREQILNLLVSARGDRVPLPKITDCAAQYNARIFELRRLGFRIQNRTQDVDGVRHSVPAKITSPFTETIPLFPADSIPERWADPEEDGR